MKIIINENQLNLLVEKLGVPNDIIETTEKFYNGIIDNLSKKNGFAFDEYTLTVNNDFNLGNSKFTEFIVKIFFMKSDKVEKLVLYKESLSFLPDLQHNNKNNTYNFKMDTPDIKNSHIELHFAAPNNVTYNEIIELLINERSRVISELSHELMHLYEKYHKKTEHVYLRANYNAVQSVGTGIKPLDNMLFSLYYLSKIELITRPSELFGFLKMENTTKTNFTDNIKKNKMYDELLKMRSLNLNDIINDLKINYVADINELFSDQDELSRLSLDEKIDFMFKIIYNKIGNEGIDVLQKLLTTSYLEVIMGFNQDKQKMMQKYQSNLSNKQNNYMLYFNKKIKKVNFYADKMIKKLSKLYDLLPNDNQSSIGSLEEWTLNQKINNVKKFNINEKLKGV